MTKASAEKLLEELDKLGGRPLSAVGGRRSSLAEYRRLEAKGFESVIVDPAAAWWRHALANPAADARWELDLAEQRALGKATGAAGGYLVPADLEQLILSVVRTRGSLARLAREFVTESGTTLSVPVSTAHGSAAWVAEAGTYTQTDETFAQVNLGAFKAATSIIASEELSADTLADFDVYLAGELGARIAQLEGAAFVGGSGSGQPQGARDNLTQLQAATGSTTKFTRADLVNALHSVAADYRDQGGAWVMSDGCLKALRREADTSVLIVEAALPGSPPMLLSYPVLVDDNLGTPAANAKSLMFAGWQAAYGIRRVNGISVQRQVELWSATGQLGYRAQHRVDGRVLIAAAGVTLQHSAT